MRGGTRCAARVAFVCAIAFQRLNMLAMRLRQWPPSWQCSASGEERTTMSTAWQPAARALSEKRAHAGPQRRRHPAAPTGSW
eukprot:11593497-Alexandrium_andersonii.AAC.1